MDHQTSRDAIPMHLPEETEQKTTRFPDIAKANITPTIYIKLTQRCLVHKGREAKSGMWEWMCQFLGQL